jgi:3,4-dihydroxy 2-butanone 4-phosphate synthase/GTP cyclohydrolase II
MSNYKLNKIEEAITAIANGEVIIVVDDAHRENEGDFVAAADKVSPEMINFMATHGRGLICTPITEARCQKLGLEKMVHNNSDPMETAFTISVDLKGKGVSTGISVHDRAKTISALINPATQAHDLSKPGHIFPLIAKEGGVLRRTGHTEAAIDFARLAGLQPAGVIVEIMNEDGSMARLPQLIEVAKKWDLKIVSIEDLVSYRMQNDSLIVKKIDTPIETLFGRFRLRAYEQTTNKIIHLALTCGQWEENESVLTRIHSSKINNDILGMLTGGAQDSLESIFKVIKKEGKGAVLFINKEQVPEDLLARISTLKELQNQGAIKKAPPLSMDEKDYGIGAQILHDLSIKKIRVISNSKQPQRIGITGYGLTIEGQVVY